MRYFEAKNASHLYTRLDKSNNITEKKVKMAIPIRKKLLENNAIIENADKIISIVTLFNQQFHEKIIDFVNSSSFSALTH
jgi:hypothetical protein